MGSLSRLDIPPELPSEARAGRQPPGQPTDPQRARTWRRRPRRRRPSEEVCALSAEPGAPSQPPPGASGGRRRELSAPPGGSARTAAMGGSASSLLDEGKCTYIRGTRAEGFPGAAHPPGGLHCCADPDPRGRVGEPAPRPVSRARPPPAPRHLRARGPRGPTAPGGASFLPAPPGLHARARARRRFGRGPAGRGCSGKRGGTVAGGRCRLRGGGRDLAFSAQPALGSVQARAQKHLAPP